MDATLAWLRLTLRICALRGRALLPLARCSLGEGLAVRLVGSPHRVAHISQSVSRHLRTVESLQSRHRLIPGAVFTSLKKNGNTTCSWRFPSCPALSLSNPLLPFCPHPSAIPPSLPPSIPPCPSPPPPYPLPPLSSFPPSSDSAKPPPQPLAQPQAPVAPASQICPASSQENAAVAAAAAATGATPVAGSASGSGSGSGITTVEISIPPESVTTLNRQAGGGKAGNRLAPEPHGGSVQLPLLPCCCFHAAAAMAPANMTAGGSSSCTAGI